MNWYYIAGFFDGEGSASIRIKPTGSISVELRITQKSRAVLDKIHQFLGFGEVRQRPNGAYDLRIRRKADIVYFINHINDHTVCKTEALELARLAAHIGNGAGKHLSDTDKQAAVLLYNALIELNRKD